jgi:alpha-beta hydrolase superfamily lysophospholipase
MKNGKKKSRWRSILSWTLWVLLVQLVLVNISASLYAYKLTHLHTADGTISEKKSSNIFTKTWRLFAGPRFYRQPLTKVPAFPFSVVSLKTKKNLSIECWYSKADSVQKGTVILIHGLSNNKGEVLDEATAFRDLSYNVMLLDFRSHGSSGGNVTTLGYREAEEVKLAYDHIKLAGEKNIFLWGTSMGAVAIMKAVSDYGIQPSGIIIEMPFLSLQSHLAGRARTLGFPEQPFGFLTTFWIGAERGFNGFRFKTTRYGANITCPVLLQYGEKDELVPMSETKTIYDAIASTGKKLVMYEGALHESFLRKDPAVWRKETAKFMEQAAKPIF